MSDLQEWVEKVRADFGELTPRGMVTAARRDGPTACPIYDQFRFDDDASAAELWRVDQARRVLRTMRVTYRETPDGAPASIRAYHAIPNAGRREHRFEPAAAVAADPVLRAVVLRSMEREWKALRARYGHMSEFVQLVLDDMTEAGAA